MTGALDVGPLVPAVEGALGRLWAHDLSFVRARILRRALMPEAVALAAELEYRRYMSLLLFDPDGHTMFSDEVDEVWHTHILFTRDYAAFCEVVFGRFIHHAPALADERLTPEAGTAQWEHFVNDYRELFGEPSYLWRGPSPAEHG